MVCNTFLYLSHWKNDTKMWASSSSGNSIKTFLTMLSLLVKDADVTAGWTFTPRHVQLVSGPQAPPGSSQPRQDATPPYASRTQNNKWVIGHKVSASLNPLLISLWGLRQSSGCSMKLAADGGMAVVTGRQAAQAWGCLLGSKQRKYNNHTLPPLFALHLSGI